MITPSPALAASVIFDTTAGAGRIRGVLRFGAALFFSAVLFSPPARAGDVEIVPGLTAKAGFEQKVGQTGQCWTWLSGDSRVLEFLRQPGILPVRHQLVTAVGLQKKTIAVENIGENDKMRDPGWLSGHIQLLRNQMKQRGGPFISSAVSRPLSKLDRGKYQITILTRNGKKLAGADGKPFSFSYSHSEL